MDQSANCTNKSSIRALALSALLVATISIIGRPLELYASPSGVDFYTPSSPPPVANPGDKSLEDLISKWWNWWMSQPHGSVNPPVKTGAVNWPQCLKGDGGIIGVNQSVIFLGNPVFAERGGENKNASNQECEIKSDQLIYLTVYPGEASTGTDPQYPQKGEYPDTKSTAGLREKAIDSNLGLKIMKVLVDGQDVSSSIFSEETTQPFNLVVPTDNPFEVDWTGNNTSMAQNYYLFFKPLPVGEHNIQLEVLRDPPDSPTNEDLYANWNIKVVP